jgi:hypothetical protein
MSDLTEAFPHLLLMAFLQRVTNGAGRIEREYAAGRGRMDLAVEYKGAWNIIEIKLLRQGKTFETVMSEGITQTLAYRDRLSIMANCYLVIFDRRPGTRIKSKSRGGHIKKPSWDERIKWIAPGNITVVGC